MSGVCKVGIINPKEVPKIIEVEDSRDILESLVGGLVDFLPLTDNLVIYYKEGAYDEITKSYNMDIFNKYPIYGTIVVTKCDTLDLENDWLVDLDEEDLKKALQIINGREEDWQLNLEREAPNEH